MDTNGLGGLINKAKSRGWQYRDTGKFVIFTKGESLITIRLMTGSSDIQSAKVECPSVNHHIKSTTQYDEGQRDTITNWLEW